MALAAAIAPASAQEFKVEKLGELINSPYDEITPIPGRDGSVLYFTRVGYPDFCRTLWIDSADVSLEETPEQYRQSLIWVYSQIAGQPIRNPENSAFNQDIWIAEGDTSQFHKVFRPEYPLNSALPNSLVALTPDPNSFYVINQFQPNGDMNRGFSEIKRLPDGTWSFPEPVEIEDYYTITSDVSLTMNYDGDVLVLSAARFDSKDMDLYVCFRTGERSWSAPLNLGNDVNSARRETAPYLSEDNATLYFSSNRGESMGGNDIFMTKRLDDSWTKWSTPVRLREPINSASDESQPYFNMSTGQLYFISKRDGSSDIYRVQIAPPQPTEIEIIGRILNRKSGRLVSNATLYYETNQGVTNAIFAENGAFKIKIPKGVRFKFRPEKAGYLGEETEFLLRRDYAFFREQYLDFYLDPVESGMKIALKPIFFQQSEAIILSKSEPELDYLFRLMSGTPQLHILISGHTDNRGETEALIALSKARAEAVKAYLVAKGIEPDRIATIGHGPAFPTNDNSTEALCAQNRRVEIEITQTRND